MATKADAETVEWRPSGAARWPQLLLGAVSLANAVLNVVFGAHGPVLIAEVVAGVLGAVLVGYVLRVRVRAAPAGVEIRVFRTRTIPYAEIAQVELDRFTGYRNLQLVLVDGSVAVTPAPRGAGVEVMTAAVEAIEYRRLMAGPSAQHPT